ncbi:MAG: efflux RND transporter permease subunit [Spirochaetaceae bacterium]|jgi:HAE1 family hydrophobic/amphiphilic exporter-1|nr:efflux RND transporter permease subunit [Spirochaetaceae bacterium]
MSITKTVVSRPVTFIIIFFLLIGLGFFALTQLPVDLFPEINPPYILVNTTYSGAGPEEVERSITRPLEQALSGVSSLDKITSTSSKGTSQITLKFIFGTDLSDATNSVRDALERVRRALPAEADSPLIFKFDPSMMPVINYRVSSTIRELPELYDLVVNTIATRMEQSPGVAAASVSGGQEKVIRVDFPESRLEAYNLTVSQIQQMIAAQNAQIGAGTITENNVSYILTTMGQYQSIDEIKNTVIAYMPNPQDRLAAMIPVLLGDLADVNEGTEDATSIVLVDGEPAIRVSVQKQSGKNSVQVVDNLRKRIPQIQNAIPQDIRIIEISSSTDQIKSTISAVTSSAISGVVLAVIVLFLFLRSIKPTIVIGVSIPISIIITIMLMYFAGLTLNLMTLAGLFLGVGMLVDNSIVILENIYHYREKGAKLRPAAILGTQEMIVAITASTLTTLCVFAPLVMFKSMLEVQGEMFAGLAFTIVISLTISLFTAIFLVPILSSHFLPLVTRKQRPLTGKLARIDGVFENAFAKLEHNYRKTVSHVLRHKALTCLVILLVFIGAIALIFKVGYVFMPEQEEDSVSINATFPLGTPLETTKEWLQTLETFARAELVIDGKPAYERITVNAGGGGRFGQPSQSHSGTLQIQLPPYKDRKLNETQVQTIMRRHFNEFPGALFRFQGGFGGGGMGGNPVDILIKTEDLKHGKEIADKIAALIKEHVPEATEPQVSMKDGLPQFEIVLDRKRMYALGVNAYNVGNEIKAAVGGLAASKYSYQGKDYDIVLRYKETDRNSRPALDRIFVKNTAGQRIPISNFAKIVDGVGPVTIDRESQSRVIHITAGSLPGVSLNIITAKVHALITREIPSEDGLVIELGGDSDDLKRIGMAFMLILVIAVCLVFGVMASLFESFKDPFIIIFTIPLSIIGVVLIYFLTGEKFNILTAVGILVLVGVIVNNGIVLVDYTNLLRKRGFSLNDACVEAAGNRLRPILMSTLTTVLGLAPIAFVPGEGTELVAPIGKTVFGGLTFGTLMTLFLMPAIYAILNKHDDEQRARREARREGLALGLKGKDLKLQAKSAAQHAHQAAEELEKKHFENAGIPPIQHPDKAAPHAAPAEEQPPPQEEQAPPADKADIQDSGDDDDDDNAEARRRFYEHRAQARAANPRFHRRAGDDGDDEEEDNK